MPSTVPIPNSFLPSDAQGWSTYSLSTGYRCTSALRDAGVTTQYRTRGTLLYPAGERARSSDLINFRVTQAPGSERRLLATFKRKVLEATAQLRTAMIPVTSAGEVVLPPSPPERVAMVQRSLSRIRDHVTAEVLEETAQMMAIVMGEPPQWFSSFFATRNSSRVRIPHRAAYVLNNNTNEHDYPLGYPLLQTFTDPRTAPVHESQATIWSRMTVPAGTPPTFYATVGNSPPSISSSPDSPGVAATDEEIENLIPTLDDAVFDVVVSSETVFCRLLQHILL